MRIGCRQLLIPASLVLMATGVYEGGDLFKTAGWQWRREFTEGVKGDGPFVDSSRILVRRNMSSGERALLWTDGKALTGIDRTLAEALCWELRPRFLAIGGDVAGCDAVVVGPMRNVRSVSAALEHSGFLLKEELDGTQLWRRNERDKNAPSVGEVNRCLRPRAARDVLAAVVFAAGILLAALPFVIVRGAGDMSHVRGLVFGMIFLFLCAYLVLGSDLPANLGLGVYGGKARLWWLKTGGVFLDEYPSCAVLQPSYPPAFPCLVWLFDILSGGCSEQCVRLLPPMFLSLAIGSLTARTGNWTDAFFIFSVFVCSPVLISVSMFAAEPLMILLAAAGIASVYDGRGRTGCLLAGCCGLVKTEGIFVAFILCVAVLWLDSTCIRGRRKFVCLALTLLPGLSWMAIAAFCGQMPQDYAPIWSPDSGRMVTAASEAFRIAFCTPWRYGFVFPLSLCIILLRIAGSDRMAARIPKRAVAAAVFALLTACVYIYILSLSRAPDFDWHCRSLARILMPPALIAIVLTMSSDASGHSTRSGIFSQPVDALDGVC